MKRTHIESASRLVVLYYQLKRGLSRAKKEKAEEIKKQSKKLKFLFHLRFCRAKARYAMR